MFDQLNDRNIYAVRHEQITLVSLFMAKLN